MLTIIQNGFTIIIPPLAVMRIHRNMHLSVKCLNTHVYIVELWVRSEESRMSALIYPVPMARLDKPLNISRLL